jgi:hypothetical protein
MDAMGELSTRQVILDETPTLPHVHSCISLICSGRQWTCTAPRCYHPPFQRGCEQCDPPPPHRPLLAPLLRYQALGETS